MQFSFDTQSVDIKEALLIRRGFRWNSRTKYQAKLEVECGAVVPAEGKRKETNQEVMCKSDPVVSWDMLLRWRKKNPFVLCDFKCSVFVFWIFSLIIIVSGSYMFVQ